MRNKNNHVVDSFLEFASLDMDDMGINKSQFAEPLYRWLELIESCRLLWKGLPMTDEEQQQKVSKVLAKKDSNEAQKMVKNIHKAAQTSVESFKLREMINPASCVMPTMRFDDKGEQVYSFGLVTINDLPPDEFAVTYVVFFNFVNYFRLKPERFQRCAKCGKHYYQHYRKNQIFCSKSCSDMGRRGKMYSEV